MNKGIRLENMMKQSGESAINSFRDKAKKISQELDLPGSYKKLDRISDSHDISGTFKIVSDKSFMTSSPHPFTDGNGRTCRIILN